MKPPVRSLGGLVCHDLNSRRQYLVNQERLSPEAVFRAKINVVRHASRAWLEEFKLDCGCSRLLYGYLGPCLPSVEHGL